MEWLTIEWLDFVDSMVRFETIELSNNVEVAFAVVSSFHFSHLDRAILSGASLPIPVFTADRELHADSDVETCLTAVTVAARKAA